jgi:uroporphyrinogen decarboxylase
VTGLARMQRAIAFETTDRVPVAPLLGAHAVARSGLTAESAGADPIAQSHALLQAVARYQPDAIFTLMDLSAEPEALGAGVTSLAGQGRCVSHHLSPTALLTGALEAVVCSARVPVFIETIRRLRAALNDTVMVGGLVSGPLTAVANAVGIEKMARMLRRERDLLQELLERLSAACLAVARGQIEAGAHGVMLLEPCATSSLLAPDDCRLLLAPHLRDLAAEIRSRGAISFLHVCGDCRASLPSLASTGFDALSLDAPVDLARARQVLGRSTALMGNLDVRHLLPGGEPASAQEAAGALVAEMGHTGGFVLSGGCELPADTPEASVRAMMGPWALDGPRSQASECLP